MVDDIVRRNGYLTLGTRFRRLGERLQSEVQRLMDERPVPVQASHYPLLAAIEENGPLPIGELSAALGLAQPGVTRTVGQLADLGVVVVRSGAKDRRTRHVDLTELGRSVVRDGRERVWPRVDAALRGILAGRTGSLLDHLDHLEDALAEATLASRCRGADGDDDHG